MVSFGKFTVRVHLGFGLVYVLFQFSLVNMPVWCKGVRSPANERAARVPAKIWERFGRRSRFWNEGMNFTVLVCEFYQFCSKFSTL